MKIDSILEQDADSGMKERLLEERSQALAALRESEERFRCAFDHAAIGMALVDLTGRWIEVNRSVCRILGYTEGELLATNFQSITHPDDLHGDLSLRRRLVAGDIPDYQMTKRYIHKDGRLVWALLSISLVRDEQENPLYFISQIQDMTERQKIEGALRSSEEEHRAMFELAGVGKAQVDLANRRYLKVNRKFCDILGYKPEEGAGLNVAQIALPEDLVAQERVAEAMMRGEISDHTIEKRYRRKNGEIVWVSQNAAIVRDPSGKPTRAVSTIVDISERKRAEWLELDRRSILERVVQDRPIEEILEQLSQAIERQVSDSMAAMMLIQEGEISIVGEGLPLEWKDAMSRSAFSLSAQLSANAWESPDECGVTLLQSDPIWKNFKQQGMQQGLHVCWTKSIQGADGSPMGMLMVFCRNPRRPGVQECQTLETIIKLAAISIEHHNTTHQLAHLVRHDALTGMANRIMFEDRLEHALAAVRREGKLAGLLMIDVDKFKGVNDSLGHQAGDHLLQQFAQRLKGCIGRGDTVARLGGDEFAVILTDLPTDQEALRMGREVVKAMEEPFALPDAPAVRIGASVGVAVAPLHADDSASLQQAADAALYHVKVNGRNGAWM